jgi:hypothetical protein
MNEFEARLWVVRTIRDVLLDLADADDPELGEDDRAEMEESMLEAAELIMEALGMDVTDVDGNAILATLHIPEG